MAEKVRKSAQEKAQAALDVVNRKLEAAGGRKAKAREAYDKAHAEIEALEKEKAYIEAHPALQAVDIDPSPVEDGIVKPEPQTAPVLSF